MRGTMLWFNAAKDAGALETHDGERFDVTGSAFVPGEKPVGRCAGRAIEFESELAPRRARLRHRR